MEDDLNEWMILEEKADLECPFGTRWKATFIGITTEEKGTYRIPLTLTDDWPHSSTVYLDIVITPKATYSSGFGGASFT